MRVDALDLGIHGNRIRVICDDAAGVKRCRSALAAHLVDEPAPPGFVVQGPKKAGDLHVVLDRSGLVLGRARSFDECLSILLSHLGVLISPPAGTIRLRMRALLNANGAVLASFPLFTHPPFIEGRLERVSYRMLDRLAVDLTPSNGLLLSRPPWAQLPDAPNVRGHSTAGDEVMNVTAVMVPKLFASGPTKAQLITNLACAVLGLPHHEAIETAERLATIPLIEVDIDPRTPPYKALPR